MPWPNPNLLRFPSTETFSSAATDNVTVTAGLASRRWASALAAQPPPSTASLTPRRWTATLATQP